MNKYWFYKVGLVVVFLCFALLGEAKVKLPTLVSDGMVLQRGEPVNIWGTADPDETVNITFQKKKYKTVADAQGNWKVILPALKAGGPYTMIINDIKNGISISKTQKRNFYFSKTERFAVQGSGEAMEEGVLVKRNRGEGNRF